MRTNTLVALIADAIIGGSSLAMARGGSGGGGGGGWSGMSHVVVSCEIRSFSVMAGAGAGLRTLGRAEIRPFSSNNLCHAFPWQT